MNEIQLHLLLGHIPIVGIAFASALLAYGIAGDKREIQKFSMVALVVLAALVIIVFRAGAAVEMLVEGFPGISGEMIAPHRVAGASFLIASQLLGACLVAGMYRYRHKSQYPSYFLRISLALGMMVCFIAVWTLYTGTRIHHAELLYAAQLKNPVDGAVPFLPEEGSEKQ